VYVADCSGSLVVVDYAYLGSVLVIAVADVTTLRRPRRGTSTTDRRHLATDDATQLMTMMMVVRRRLLM